MDCDYDPNAASTSTEKPKKKRNRYDKKGNKIEKSEYDENDPRFERYTDELYKLDYEDMIGDIPCRFKYREVMPNDFGLSLEEILIAKDRELNRWCSLKKATQHRPEHVERYEVMAYRKKAENEALKKKILGSLYEELEEPTEDEYIKLNKERMLREEPLANEENIEEQEKNKKKKKSKKETTAEDEYIKLNKERMQQEEPLENEENIEEQEQNKKKKKSKKEATNELNKEHVNNQECQISNDDEEIKQDTKNNVFLEENEEIPTVLEKSLSNAKKSRKKKRKLSVSRKEQTLEDSAKIENDNTSPDTTESNNNQEIDSKNNESKDGIVQKSGKLTRRQRKNKKKLLQKESTEKKTKCN